MKNSDTVIVIYVILKHCDVFKCSPWIFNNLFPEVKSTIASNLC